MRPCCGLLGANRFCQPSSQRPGYGFVTLPSLQRGWRGLDGHTGSWGGRWRSGSRARSKKRRWRWAVWPGRWTDARAATCIRGDPASTHCPPATATSNHPLEGLTGPSAASEHSSVPHSAGMQIGGMQAAKILFLDLFSITSGMEFCGDGTGPVFIKQLSYTPGNHSES